MRRLTPEILMVAEANVGNWKVTSAVLAGGAGNCMNTGMAAPASMLGRPVVVSGRPSVSRST